MKKKILLIDDHPTDNSNFISVLRAVYEVDVTAYIETARIKLKQHKYDLVVIDIMMPSLGEDFNGKDTDDKHLLKGVDTFCKKFNL
jgi:PleD family two-component response regulator